MEPRQQEVIFPTIAVRDSRFFTTGDFFEVARGPWLTGDTHFIHTRYFKEKMVNLDTLQQVLISLCGDGEEAFSWLVLMRSNFSQALCEYLVKSLDDRG